MTIDERLEFLTQSTESLHASCQELHAAIAKAAENQDRLDERERRARHALKAGIIAYLEALDEGQNGEA